MDYKSVKQINKPNIERIYQVLAKLLSEDEDYEVKFTITRKEDE